MANNTVLYGFRNLDDLTLNSQVTPAMVPTITDAIEESRQMHNVEMNSVMSLLAEPVTNPKEHFKTATSARLQPLDEDGRARSIKASGGFDIAYPIKKAGIAEGNNFETGVLQTVADVQEVTAMMFLADNNWMMDQLLAACYNNADWVYPDKKWGDLTVKPIANGDAQTYFTNTGASTGVAQNNLLFQAASIDDTHNALYTAANQLRKFPGDRSKAISLVPTNLIDSVMGLTGFIDQMDDNVQAGANTDVLQRGPGVAYPGALRGYDRVSRTWVVEWDRLQDNRIFVVPIGGARPIGFRQYDAAQLQGFVLIGERNDLPYYERQYSRWGGFGARNRTALVGIQVGNSSWTVPTGFNPANMG